MSKKGMYHSELVKMSPVTARIMSEPQDSKFPDRPKWVALEIDGQERFLSCENVSIELALAGLKDQWAKLNARGRGEDAIIEIEDAPAKQKSEVSSQKSERLISDVRSLTSDEDGVLAARKHIMQAANLYNLCVACVDKAVAPSMPIIAQTADMFQAAVGTLFIEASRAGFVAKMPQVPLKKDIP